MASRLRLPSSTFLSISLAASLLTQAGPAVAQDDPEMGDMMEEEPPPPVAEEEPEAQAPPGWGVADDTESPDGEGSGGDSEGYEAEGSFGIGLFGLAELPLPGNTKFPTTLPGPVIGGRYWFTEGVGLEVGLALSLRWRTDAATASDGTAGEESSSAWGLGLVAGVPIAVHRGQDYALLLIPYLGIGTASATDGSAFEGEADDIFLSGFLLELGLKAGVEMRMGALGLPGLGLQFAAGVRLRTTSLETDAPGPDTDGDGVPNSVITEGSSGTIEFTPGGSLGSLIAGMISAVYYF